MSSSLALKIVFNLRERLKFARQRLVKNHHSRQFDLGFWLSLAQRNPNPKLLWTALGLGTVHTRNKLLTY